MTPKKRTKPSIVLFILPAKIQRVRLSIFEAKCKEIGLELVSEFGEAVTHIASELDSAEDIKKAVLKNCSPKLTGHLNKVILLTLQWVSDCLKTKAVVAVEDKHTIAGESVGDADDGSDGEEKPDDFPEFACFRRTPLDHPNKKLTDAISVLEEDAEHRGGDHQQLSRALAFHRCIATLRSYPRLITSLKVAARLPHVGTHCKRVIKEILETGKSEEIEAIQSNPNFIAMKELTSVYGVGQATARKWLQDGVHNVKEACSNQQIQETKKEQLIFGLAFHEDLHLPVTKGEAESWQLYVSDLVQDICPGMLITLTGGFRRGKSEGHDIDLLLTHPDEGREVGVLPKVVAQLHQQGLIVQNPSIEPNTFNPARTMQDKGTILQSNLDHFETWMGIVKFNKGIRDEVNVEKEEFGGTPLNKILKNAGLPEVLKVSHAPRDWWARRVDLVITPYSQYYYALVGWTGSKHFNRDLRLYSQKKLNMKLTSHVLFDMNKNTYLPASSEEEVFSNLNLPVFPPEQRNA